MEKASKATFILILLIAALLFQSPLSVKGEPSERRFTITSTVTYTNNGTNIPWNLTGEDYAISLFMNNSWQSVSLAEHSLSLNYIRNDTDGNLLGFFNVTQLNPDQNVSYTVKYDIISEPRSIPNITENQSQSLADIPVSLKDEYCKKEGSWLTDDASLRVLATSLRGSKTKVLSIVKDSVRWITDHIVYDSEEVPRYPNETINDKKGDCDDQAILLITLCRIIGIPAYLQVGCIFQFGSYPSPEEYWEGHVTSVLRQIGWHGWAIVYVPPWGWLPVDLTYVRLQLFDDPNDPLNNIRRAAVAEQDTIQYMNFTSIDYVGTSRRLRKLIQENDFYVYMIDEMKTYIDFGSMWEIIKLVLKTALTATAVIAFSLAAVFIYKWKKTAKLTR